MSVIIKECLNGNRNYYVRTDGNDENDGLSDSTEGAFLTVQRAIDVASSLDLGPYDCRILIANGTYVGQIEGRSFSNSGGKIIIEGDTSSPSNIKLQSNSGTLLTLDGVCGVYAIQGVETQTSSSGHHFAVGRNSNLQFGSLVFGATATNYAHIHSFFYGIVNGESDYSISGGAYAHCLAIGSGAINIAGKTLTISSPVTFSYNFVSAERIGYIEANSCTFTNPGNVSGGRYQAFLNGAIYTNGGGATYFPGTVAGTTSSGGQYS